MVSLEDARRVIAAAEKKAQQIHQPMNIAVADEGANLVAHVRMDGAWLGSIDVSINKAYTARAFDISTKDLAAHSQSGGQFFGIHVSNHGRIMILAGVCLSSAAERSSVPSGYEDDGSGKPIILIWQIEPLWPSYNLGGRGIPGSA